MNNNYISRIGEFTFYTIFSLVAIFAFHFSSFAQPANNDCANASIINISNGGFGQGLFTSTQYDLSAATLQSGETFAPSITTAGLNKKSIWYKFTLPTTRAARISLAQPGSGIQAGNVGFAVYKTTACLPTNTDISTKFSPIEIFGSSYHPCVDAGDYLVQVTGNNNANGPVFITVDLSDTTNSSYDKSKDAYEFTNINNNKTSIVDFLVQCQTIDDAAENCLPSSSFKDYTKSTWHTFTTPAYFDWFSVLLTALDNLQTPTYVVGYRIYKGNAVTTPVSSLVLLNGCDSMKINGYYPDKKVYRCGDLLPGTTYSVQLLYHKDFNKIVRMGVAWNGLAATKGPEPTTSMPASNNMGTLLASSAGLNNMATDNLGCNSRHSEHTCPKSMPASGVLNGGYRYNLSTFFAFTLATTSTLNFTVNPSCSPAPLVRLFKQSLSANCSDLDTSNIINVFGYNSGPIQCLDPGAYVLQVMGADTTIPQISLHHSSLSTTTSALCLQQSLGSKIELTINVKTEVASNKFSLSATGNFDKINANEAGVMQPLQRGITYTGKPDTLGCKNTVLPDDDLCQPGTSQVNTKASYREFILTDSVILYVPDYISSASSSKIFKGDANALATSQAAFNYPQKITGLQAASGCFSGYSSSTQNACLTPGTYTLANYDSRLGYEVTTKFTILKPESKFNTPAKAQDMGDIWQSIDPIYNLVMSAVDTFTCYDNPLVIDGVNPCNGVWSVPATKQIYRQFYLSKPAIVSIFDNYFYRYFTGSFTLFSGKATDGIARLKSMGAKWTCFTNLTSSQCESLPAGWYTVVSYGVGPNYSNPLPGNPYNIQNSDAGRENGFFIRLTVACPQPKFNRPHKASIDTLTGQPYKLEWSPQPGHTAAYPVTSKKYTLNTENFDCSQDTTFINNYMQRCSAANVKVAFYVFQLTQESYVQIGALPYDFVVSMYNFDVRGSDSSRLKTDPPLQPCLDNKVSEFCKLQPGIYTLVIYGSAVYSTSCMPVTPTIYVDQVGTSRFDHAINAYDFGSITPDSAWHDRKTGDVNPLDATRAPSNDFFYCTTGAQQNDPAAAACMSFYNRIIYQAGTNVVLHPNNTTSPDQTTIDRRNLWYTFTVDHPGNVRIAVKNMTIGKKNSSTHQYPFTVFKSDVNGTLPFTQVVSNGMVDSTLLQGLTLVGKNWGNYNYCAGTPEIELFVPPCSFTPTRYYIIVENRNPYGYDDVRSMNPNSQVEVSILLDSVTARPPKFDHFSEANDLGLVNSGIKKGETDNFTCATKDPPDPLNYQYVTGCNKTLWYKFTTSVTGQIRYAAFFKGTNQNYYDHIQLFRQIKPNDSSANGLMHLTYTTTYSNNGTWAQQCISPGTYYIILPGCNAVDENVYPQIEIIPQAGDFCSDPMLANLAGPGSKVIPVTIDCHTIGTDYGEFNPTLTCPANAPTANYKTSWYRLDITGKDTLDVTVYINENTNATSTDIKYRMMTGNCGAMQEQSCVQDALTRNTYKCLAPGNSYYIQVFTPVSQTNTYPYQVTGTIDLNLSAVIHQDVCLPSNNCIGVANFTPKFDCTKDRDVLFTNFSTYGSSIAYEWDFGFNNQKSNAVSPSFFYPALTTAETYTVKLVINNTTPGCDKKDSSIQTITIPARPAANLGSDALNCTNGTAIPLNATSHSGSTYYWYNGNTQPTIIVGGIASAWVEVTYKGCKVKDTINVWINPIAKQALQTKALCNVTTVTLSGSRGQGEQYQWNTGASTSSITVAQPGYYWVDLYLNGCTVRDSFLVVNADLKPLGNDTALCQRNLPFIANATVNGASSYTWQNNSTSPALTITQPGIYWVDILLGGCTFRDTLMVSVDSFKTATLTARICQGQVYTLPSGKRVNIAGNFTDTLRNRRGCDSMITNLTLKVDVPTQITSSASICTGQTYTLPSGVSVSRAGTYYDTVRYASGCDSLTTTLTLTVSSVTSLTRNPSVCEGQGYTLPSGRVVTASGTYVETIRHPGVCDSIITTQLVVNTVSTTTLSPVICQGQDYTMPSGIVVNVTGTYRDTLRYGNGCDSMRNTVHLTVKTVTNSSITAAMCQGQSYTLPSGVVVTAAGVYMDTVRYTSGCDSLRSVITLTIKALTRLSNAATICEGQSYTLPSGKRVNVAGTYNDTVRYVTGCDSAIYTVNVNVKKLTRATVSPSVCAGQSYTLPSGVKVNAPLIYSDTLRYANGCDSLITSVNLTVKAVTTSTLTRDICQGQSYKLPSGVVVTAPGTYTDTVRYAGGCDSLRSTITLSLKQVIRASATAVICGGQKYTLPSGATVTAGGIYTDTMRYPSGCDSLITTINLRAETARRVTISASVCSPNGYTMPSGETIRLSGTYNDTLRSRAGCDSVITTINLNVTEAITVSLTLNICQGETFTMPTGIILASSGTYRDTLHSMSGCDSVVSVVELTVNPLPIVTVSKSNDINCILASSTLNATGGSRYTWSPTSSLSNGSISNPVASPNVTTTYVVRVTTNKGCMLHDSVQVTVNAADPDGGLLMPSAFTPNNDGKNDCFGVKHWGRVSNLNLAVYDRLGFKVFQTSNPSECWDGIYKGERLGTAAFVYHVSATTICGPVNRKGTVVLIR
jgi:gliding motility-associated-like protein